jgi:phosphate:Na+ symporter
MVGVVVVLPLLPHLGSWLVGVESDTARAVADFHTAFNLVLAALFMPLLKPWANLLCGLLPSRVEQSDPGVPLYLDPAARDNPSIALGCAAREALRLTDVLEEMLKGLKSAFETADRRKVADTRRLDDTTDRLTTAIKTYVTALDTERLGESDHTRLREILTFATNVESAGDLIDANLLGIVSKMIKRGLAFSKAGEADVLGMIDRLIANTRTAASLFMTGDIRAARALAAEKDVFRNLESTATDAHFARFRAGEIDSVETSTLHLDALRDLRGFNAYLVAAAAYPILERRGELLPSRLRDGGDEAAGG